jgi:hypothetical protein
VNNCHVYFKILAIYSEIKVNYTENRFKGHFSWVVKIWLSLDTFSGGTGV